MSPHSPRSPGLGEVSVAPTALDGQVAVVTGGGSGIGRATAAALATRGVRCVLVGRRENVLATAVGELPTGAGHVAADLTEPGAPERVVDEVLADHGRIDLLVHAAGRFDSRPVEDTDDEFWRDVLELNLGATMALTRAAWSALGDSGGQIVLVSSVAAIEGFPGDAAYAASKGGVNALGGVLALEGRPHGIRIVTVCPGQVDTELWDGTAPDQVRARMMTAAGVGELVASLVATDRSINIAPVFIRPTDDPWARDAGTSP